MLGKNHECGKKAELGFGKVGSGAYARKWW